EMASHNRDTCSHEPVHLFRYDADEVATDWSWCGDPADAPRFTCPHPDLTAPNSGIVGQYCVMSPMLAADRDRALGMRTDGVNRFDCAIMSGQVCHNEPAGRPAIRTQTDPK